MHVVVKDKDVNGKESLQVMEINEFYVTTELLEIITPQGRVKKYSNELTPKGVERSVKVILNKSVFASETYIGVGE